MSPTLFEIGVALAMVVVAAALLVWFARDLRANSDGRLTRMLMRAGVDSDIATRGDSEAVIKDLRSRCSKCRAEALCERWLAGQVDGENTFCPNLPIFNALADNRGRNAAPRFQPR